MLSQLMNYVCVFVVVLLLGVCTYGSETRDAQKKNVVVELVSGKDFEKVLQKYPGAVPLVPTRKAKPLNGGPQNRDIVTYSLGYRISGDYRVTYETQSYSWAVPQDIQLKVSYPSNGVGAIVSYVEIVVTQSNSLGRAYVTSGGIGQRYISIVVEAVGTYWFDYVISIYGY